MHARVDSALCQQPAAGNLLEGIAPSYRRVPKLGLDAAQRGPLDAGLVLAQPDGDLLPTPRHLDKAEARIDGRKRALDLEKEAAGDDDPPRTRSDRQGLSWWTLQCVKQQWAS